MIFFYLQVLGRERSVMNPSVTPMRNELEDWLPMQNIASLRNQWMPRKPGSPTPYEENEFMEKRRQNIARNQEMLRIEENEFEEKRRQNIARNQEMLRSIIGAHNMNPSVTPMRNELEDWLPMQNIARNQWMPRKPGSPTPYYYEEKRRRKIARNQEMLRSIMGPDVGPTKNYTRGQDSESAGTASETPGETALVILRSTGGNAERALGGAWGTPAAFVQSLARCGMSLNPAAVN